MNVRTRRTTWIGCIAVTIAMTCAVAEPPEVTGLGFDAPDFLSWDDTPGAFGYHVYSGNLADLPDYGACVQGSVQGTSYQNHDLPAPGQALFYLIGAYDPSGEGTLGDPGAGERIPGSVCIPVRRGNPFIPNEDPGDGVLDGREPRRNPSAEAWDIAGDRAGVYLHTGEFFVEAKDFEIAGRGMPFVFLRKYRSQIAYDGPLGHGWDFDYNARLVPWGTDVLYHDGRGRSEHFERIDTTHFGSPPGLYAVLRGRSDGSFTLRYPDGTMFSFRGFDGTNRQGTLQWFEDRNGNHISLLYDLQGLLTTVVDTMGRVIAFEYDDTGHLTRVIDWTGRTWQYGYNDQGDLETVTSPAVTGTPNGNDYSAGKTTTYEYESGHSVDIINHNMNAIQTPFGGRLGRTNLEVGYGFDPPAFDVDRVITANIGGSYSFSYMSVNQGFTPGDPSVLRRSATVVDPNANQSVHHHNWVGNLRNRVDDVPSEGTSYSVQYAYNTDGEIVRADLPAWNTIKMTYDSPGVDRYREGNLVELRYEADSILGAGRGDGRGAEIADVVWTYGYDPIYNQRFRVTDPRGNDPTYVPPNGGAHSPERYTSVRWFDYQEGDPQFTGLETYILDHEIDPSTALFDVGDLNGDGLTNQIAGNVVKVDMPTVALDAGSEQAAIEGDTSQDITTTIEWNYLGQIVEVVDAEGGRHARTYTPEADPDGDGTPTFTPADGRLLNVSTGGYPATSIVDVTGVALQTDYHHDVLGHQTGIVNGRGVLTARTFNTLDQIVEIRRGAATADSSGPWGDPATGRGEPGLDAPGYRVWYEYGYDDPVESRWLEDPAQDRGCGPWVPTHWAYDLFGRLTDARQEHSDGLMLHTQYRYDPNGNLTRVVHPEGNEDSYEYDERDLLTGHTPGVTGPVGGATGAWVYDHDANGNLTSTTDPLGNSTTLTYDGFDRRVQSEDALSGTREWWYDPVGNVVRELIRGSSKYQVPAIFNLSDTYSRHDELGRVIRIDRALFVPPGWPTVRALVLEEGPLVPGDDRVNRILEYDRLSRLTFEHRDSGALTYTQYDGASRPILQSIPGAEDILSTYDDAGILVEQVRTEMPSVAGPPPEERIDTWFHDALGHTTMHVDPLGHTSRWEYDALDAVAVATDPRGPEGGAINRRSPGYESVIVPINHHGNVTQFHRDGAGRLIESTRIVTATGEGDGGLAPPPDTSNPNNPDGLVTMAYGWTANSRLLYRTDDPGHTTQWAYDDLDRVITILADDGTETATTYTVTGRPQTVTDPNGTVATHAYDALGRLRTTNVARAAGVQGTEQQTFFYDGLDRLLGASDDNDPSDSTDDSQIFWLYDSLDRPVEELQMFGSEPQQVTSYGWLADDLPLEVVYPSGDTVAYFHDEAERLAAIETPTGTYVEFEWFGVSRVHTRRHHTGVWTAIDRDPAGRTTRLAHHDPSDTLIAGWEYTYDRASNRTAMRRLHDPGAAGEYDGEIYRHDSVSALVDFIDASLDPSFAVVGSPHETQSWLLDGACNWAGTNLNGVDLLATPNNNHEYDEPQSNGERTDDGIPDDFRDLASTAEADGLNFAHDKNGSRTVLADWGITYDFNARPVHITSPTTTIATYKYDGLGRRIRREVDGTGKHDGVWRYLYAGAVAPQAVEVQDGLGDPVESVVYAGSTTLSRRLPGDTLQYLLQDAAGNVSAVADPDGAILERVIYGPYGLPRFLDPDNDRVYDDDGLLPASAVGNTRLWAGMMYDPEMGVRTFDPVTDRGGMYAAQGGMYSTLEGRYLGRASAAAAMAIGNPYLAAIGSPVSKNDDPPPPPDRRFGFISNDPIPMPAPAGLMNWEEDPPGNGKVMWDLDIAPATSASFMDTVSATPMPLPTPRSPYATPQPIPDPGQVSATPITLPNPRGQVSATPITLPNPRGQVSATPITLPGKARPMSATPQPIPDPGQVSATPITLPGKARPMSATPQPIPDPGQVSATPITLPNPRGQVSATPITLPNPRGQVSATPITLPSTASPIGQVSLLPVPIPGPGHVMIPWIEIPWIE